MLKAAAMVVDFRVVAVQSHAAGSDVVLIIADDMDCSECDAYNPKSKPDVLQVEQQVDLLDSQDGDAACEEELCISAYLAAGNTVTTGLG